MINEQKKQVGVRFVKDYCGVQVNRTCLWKARCQLVSYSQLSDELLLMLTVNSAFHARFSGKH